MNERWVYTPGTLTTPEQAAHTPSNDEHLATLEAIRATGPSWANLQHLINAVSYVCSQVKGMDVSLVQDLLDEASGALENVYAFTDEERSEHAREAA